MEEVKKNKKQQKKKLLIAKIRTTPPQMINGRPLIHYEGSMNGNLNVISQGQY